jgi:hypothetical protein
MPLIHRPLIKIMEAALVYYPRLPYPNVSQTLKVAPGTTACTLGCSFFLLECTHNVSDSKQLHAIFGVTCSQDWVGVDYHSCVNVRMDDAIRSCSKPGPAVANANLCTILCLEISVNGISVSEVFRTQMLILWEL